jgi:membrane-bound lytic murein transglycosylase D
MQQKLLRTLAFTASLLMVAPFSSHANDLSISPSITVSTYDPTDPATQVLAMEELDVWGRIRNGFGIPDLENPLVVSQTNWYSTRPEYIQRTTLRASRYLFHVLQELEKRDMPTELALLPFIESAFNPEAYSSAKASGMWQFIPSTDLFAKAARHVRRLATGAGSLQLGRRLGAACHQEKRGGRIANRF